MIIYYLKEKLLLGKKIHKHFHFKINSLHIVLGILYIHIKEQKIAS